MPDDTSRDDDFNCNHPIFNAISYENGQINRMSLNQVIIYVSKTWKAYVLNPEYGPVV